MTLAFFIHSQSEAKLSADGILLITASNNLIASTLFLSLSKA